MVIGDNSPDELEKLLAEVKRTIRENSQFIRNLKEESANSGDADAAGDSVVDDGYEEL